MDPTEAPSTDGAVILTMMAILMNMAPPKAVAMALPLGDAAAIIHGNPAEISLSEQPQPQPDVPILADIDGLGPPIRTDHDPKADQHLVFTSADFASEAKAAPQQAQVPIQTPPPADQKIKEFAFLARLEPDSKSTQPIPAFGPPLNLPEALVAIVTPILTASPKARPLTTGELVQRNPSDEPMVPPIVEATPSMPRFDNIQPPLLPLVKVKRSEDLPNAATQIVTATALDRAVSNSTPAHVSLPASVPASLIDQAAAAERGSVEVVLDPKELGKVRFEIHQHGDQVRVFLAVERPETLELLRRNADQLVQEFRAAGYAGASLNFGQWGGQKGGSSAHAGRAKSELSLQDLSSQPIPTRNFAPTQGLNLRL